MYFSDVLCRIRMAFYMCYIDDGAMFLRFLDALEYETIPLDRSEWSQVRVWHIRAYISMNLLAFLIANNKCSYIFTLWWLEALE